jgi:flagellar biosynthesis GTPase FlhF
MAAQGPAQPLETAEEAAPTPIEQALMEHVCSVVPAGGAPEADRYLVCMKSQLLSLRTDFGRDLSRLSAPERKAADAACNEIRATSGRDAYLDCLGNQLAIFRSKRNRGNASAVPVMPATTEDAGQTPVAPANQGASGSPVLLIGGGFLVALVAGGGGFLFLKTRRVLHKCRVCGAHVESSGDLCQTCRHEAAEAVRRAVAERADQQRAQEEEKQRQKEHAVREEEERLKKAQEEEDARRRRQQEREREEARKREAEERRRQDEEARERRLAVAVSGGEFDPYEVLEVARGASEDDIRAAYEVARDKSDPSQVSHLSDEVQEHFRLKSKAVERAFQTLVKQQPTSLL